MYTKILVPIDLAHLDSLEKALKTAADLSKLYSAAICYASVSTAAPSAVAHNPDEFKARLDGFAAEQAKAHGVSTTSAALLSHDPTIDLDATLVKAVGDLGCDLVIMGSHKPGFVEHFVSSNAGYVANHARVSVLVVR